MDDDEKLLRRAERALAEIKIAHGLSDRHASVLAALRIRLKGDPGKDLEELLTSAGDLGRPQLDDMMDRPEPSKGSLDDLLSKKPKPKPDWPA
jgi:hypothetical protein